jgi:predicted nucleic acid-binding protein
MSVLNDLLDTNILSEYRQPNPNPGVIKFLRELDFSATYLSVVTLSEIRSGAERLPKGKLRDGIEHWLEWALQLDFQDRVLGIHIDVALAAGRIRGLALDTGRPMSVMDAFIAATAEVHDLRLVTLNTKDFEVWGGPLFNPWDNSPPA